MLFIKFIMCLGTIIVIGMMTSCNAINGGSDNKHGDASQNQGEHQTEFSNTPLKTADLTGAAQNTFEIFSYSQQDGLWRLGSTAFQIQVPGPGTFLILSTGINSKTCSPDQARTTFALFEVNDTGALANMRPIDTQFPIVFYEAKTLQLQVDTAVKAHCTSLSPAEVFVTTKYISQEKDSLPAVNNPSSGENPDQPQNPSGPGQPGQPTNPTRPLPTPVTCDTKPWPTDLPPVYKSKIRLWATPSLSEGCKNTFTWSVAETARLDPLNDCAAPNIAIDQPQEQFIKISESFSTHRMQLLWLLTQSAGAASQIKERMSKGETIDLTYEGDHCLTQSGDPQLPQRFEKLTSPTDYLLFRGDSREEGISKSCGLTTFQTLEAKRTTAGLNEIAATYDYRANTPESFYYNLDFKFVHSADDLKATWKAALFNRKTHAFIEPWKQLEGANSFHNSLKLKNPDALRRLLPNQEHIELVLRPQADCKPGGGAEQKIYDLGALFSGSSGEQYFRDLKYPEQSRFLLSEDDLPL